MKFFNPIILCFLLLLLLPFSGTGQEQEVKNVILMIPDGTSVNLLSIARWYQQYQDPEKTTLAVDPHLCGMVKTHSSDAPIGDSAPTTSCYVTGQPTQTGFVSMYPRKTDQDLVPVDSTLTYQPLVTVLEAAKYLHGKSTGLVFTCEFPHATPADCAAHWYKRSNSSVIAKQMVYNNIDVVIGGGVNYLLPEYKTYLQENDYEVVLDDLDAFNKSNSLKMWALFHPEAIPYDIDRNPLTTPSLKEMTRKALKILSKNKEGFFLMIEGSRIDWAAHDNDIKTMITEYLAFDEAVREALNFANRNGETAVIVLPDHGTSGVNLGNRNANSGYDRLSLETIIRPITNHKISIEKMVELVKASEPSKLQDLFLTYFNIELTEEELNALYYTKDYHLSPISKEERKNGISTLRTISQLVNKRTFIGFTTYGHTGEDVFLSAYHPYNDIPSGLRTNIEINEYLCRQLKLTEQLPILTNQLFVPHQTLFENLKKATFSIDSVEQKAILTVKSGKKKLEIESNTNYYYLNGERFFLRSIALYVDRNKTFYLPAELINIFN